MGQSINGDLRKSKDVIELRPREWNDLWVENDHLDLKKASIINISGYHICLLEELSPWGISAPRWDSPLPLLTFGVKEISACRGRLERHEVLVCLCLYSAGTRSVQSPTLLTRSSWLCCSVPREKDHTLLSVLLPRWREHLREFTPLFCPWTNSWLSPSFSLQAWLIFIYIITSGYALRKSVGTSLASPKEKA